MATRILNSFQVRSNGKILDYRLGAKLDIQRIRSFFQKTYLVNKLWQGHRHILGILEKDNITYFLKLSTSEGISVVTRNEYEWNNYFNRYLKIDSPFSVPINYESGSYQNIYFYLITNYFNGKLLCEVNGTYEESSHLMRYVDQVIELSQVIQRLPAIKFTRDQKEDCRKRFINKVNGWLEDIPADIRAKYGIKELFEIVERGVGGLLSKPRHGDFTPWHIIRLPDKKLGLIDGEHALPDSIENYDICYFIQRVFSVLKSPHIAKMIYSNLLGKAYKADKLKTVLASRVIGGFLDESLTYKPSYKFANDFKVWITNLT